MWQLVGVEVVWRWHGVVQLGAHVGEKALSICMKATVRKRYGYCPSTSASAEAPPSRIKLRHGTLRPVSTDTPPRCTLMVVHTMVVAWPRAETMMG